MTRGSASRARRCLAFAGALWLVGAVTEASDAPLPLRLERPGDGRPVTVEAGPRALHLVFFATWCRPCLDEMRALAEIEARFVDRGYRLVLISVPARQTAERLAAFARESALPGELLFDGAGTAQASCGIDRLPGHVLLDGKGAVVLRTGALADGIEEAIDRLLNGPSSGGARKP